MTEVPLGKVPPVLPINTARLHSHSSLFPFSPFPLPLNGFPAMLSALPPSFSGDSFLGNPFPPFEPFFPTPEFNEPAFAPKEPPCQAQVTTDSGSDEPNRDCTNLNEPERTNSKTIPSGSDETGSVIDERKRRRMESNRESARRSRMRKQRHLENLRNLANRLKLGKRELVKRLNLVLRETHVTASENESLRSEATLLRQRLSYIRQVLLVRHLQQHLNPVAAAWPCINNGAAAPPLTPHGYCTSNI